MSMEHEALCINATLETHQTAEVIMMDADVLAPNRCQAIINHTDSKLTTGYHFGTRIILRTKHVALPSSNKPIFRRLAGRQAIGFFVIDEFVSSRR